MENRYDKYKDSGVEWIGEIPEHWIVKRLKFSCNIWGRIGFRGYKSDDLVSEGEGAITLSPSNMKDMKMDYTNRTYLSWKKYYESPEIMVSNNDILMVKTGSSYGKCSFVENMPMECTINPQIVVFKQHRDYPKFLAYSFQTEATRAFVETSVVGGTIPTISQEKIMNYFFAFPPFSEQQSIATYLDQKCGEIDELITLQEEMITKLQSYKQSVITEAVTKGLDKNVPLKDSGIEWIGEIPEHWEVVDLRHLCKKITDGSHFSPQITDEGGFYITVSNVFDDKIHFENAHKISIKDFNTLITNGCQPPIGSVLLTKDGTVGRTAVVTDNNFVVLSSLAILSLKSNILAEYVKYVLDSETLQEQMKLLMAGSALRRITLNKIYTLKMIYAPSSFEQQAIADYLDQRCSEIDELISIKQQKIEKLKEYKKSLIFECVTGKRKVS